MADNGKQPEIDYKLRKDTHGDTSRKYSLTLKFRVTVMWLTIC